MDYTFSLLTNNQWYLFYLASIMILSGYAKDLGWFRPAYVWVLANVKSKRMVVSLISLITGVLPITGRVTVSAGFLDTIAPKDKSKRQVFGIIDYLSTHHYYLWSPLEKSVILPMAALGISYWVFLSYMLPLLIGAFAVIAYYIFGKMSEDDIEIDTSKFNNSDRFIQKNPLIYVNWYAILMLFVIIILGNFAKGYTEEITMFVESNVESILYVSVISFIGAFILGSSSRFAALTAIGVTVYGIEYLPWFFALDYAGYMLSPTHKCLGISKMYFGTPLKDYYTSIGVLCGLLMIIGAITSFML